MANATDISICRMEMPAREGRKKFDDGEGTVLGRLDQVEMDKARQGRWHNAERP